MVRAPDLKTTTQRPKEKDREQGNSPSLSRSNWNALLHSFKLSNGV